MFIEHRLLTMTMMLGQRQSSVAGYIGKKEHCLLLSSLAFLLLVSTWILVALDITDESSRTIGIAAIGTSTATAAASLHEEAKASGTSSTPGVIIPAEPGDDGSNLNYYYVYEPEILPIPVEANIEHAHGIFVSSSGGGDGSDEVDNDDDDDDFKVIITYKDQSDDSKCLLGWKNDLTKPAEFLGPGSKLCSGVPHGLSAIVDGQGEVYLYHANNEQHLSKTTLNGRIIWTHNQVKPVNDSSPFRPTWFAGEPNSPYLYLTDGYGSSRIYLYYKTNGTYAGQYFGGIGTSPGLFQTSHGLSWDDRFQQMVVSDRENHRLQYFEVDSSNGTKFQYVSEQSFLESNNLHRPCNIRFHPSTKQAIIPFLEGNVAILKPPTIGAFKTGKQQVVESVFNISRHLGDQGYLHPHDVHFISNTDGDFVLVTWNPGRIGYFRKVTNETIKATTQ